MKKKFYYSCLLFGFVFGMMVFTACGGNDDSNNSTPQPGQTDRDASGNLKISAINFPDDKFRNFLLSQSYGSDGLLSATEIASISELDVSNIGIVSMKGIENFWALTNLVCYNNQLITLDVSRNTNLTGLRCFSNQLTSLNVSGCVSLEWLHCYDNKLAYIDVSRNTKLTQLACYNNLLSSLDISKNTELVILRCSGNKLSTLDVSKNKKLTTLDCDYNVIIVR